MSFIHPTFGRDRRHEGGLTPQQDVAASDYLAHYVTAQRPHELRRAPLRLLSFRLSARNDWLSR